MNFQHDCNKCMILGSYSVDNKVYDLYYCPTQPLGGSCIARFGDKGSEYCSIPKNLIELHFDAIMQSSTDEQAVVEAYRRGLRRI